MFGAILLLGLTVRSTSADVCSNSCGSLANSRNPLGDMNNLLTSGMNCSNGPYYPLTTSPQPFNNLEGGMCSNSYYPQQPATYPGMPMTQQPLISQSYNNGANTSSPFIPAGQNDAECEITTSVECKPKKNNFNNLTSPVTYPGMPITQQPGPGNGGNGQSCDCSMYNNNLTSQGGYNNLVPGMILTNDPCNCANNNQYYTSPSVNNNTSPAVTNGFNNFQNYTTPNNYSRPAFCGSGMVNGKPTVGNAILNAFDCNKSYTLPPTRSAVIGTTELPIADGFRASPSSCSIANNACAS